MGKLGKPDIQILLLGDCGVGKTCSIIRFDQDKFINAAATQGIDFKQKPVIINNKVINTRIWDTAGQERYKTITTAYIRGADLLIICYSVTDIQSYNHLSDWVKTIRIHNKNPSVPIMIVGTKIDDIEHRTITYEDAYKTSKKFGAYYYEISGKTGENVEKTFTDAVKIASKIPISSDGQGKDEKKKCIVS